jgi:hypothetical protein
MLLRILFGVEGDGDAIRTMRSFKPLMATTRNRVTEVVGKPEPVGAG